MIALEGLTAAGSYGFNPLGLYSGAAASTAQLASLPSYTGLAPNAQPASSFLQCDDQGLMSQYLQHFPPLQPSRVMASGPSAQANAMVYPPASRDAQYSISVRPTSNVTDSTLRVDHPLSSPQTGIAMSAGFGAGMNQAGQAPGSFINPPSRIDVAARYEPQSSFEELPAAASSGPVGPHQVQRTTSVSRRGPFKTQDAREKTAQTRKIGSCIRCRMQRIRVSLRCSPVPEPAFGG
jgi:hypothetical protein